MLDFKKENLLLSIFQKRENSNDSIAQITILTIKSLMPSSSEVGNRIDYRRFNEELKLWKYYRMGENLSLLNILGQIDEYIYFKSKDETLYSRIVPIVLANRNFDIIEDEIIKNIIYSTGDIETLFEWLLIGKILYLLIGKEEDIIDILKEYIINISQRALLNRYKDIYRIDLDRYHGNYTVDFERNRIRVINLLNGIDAGGYDTLRDILNILSGDSSNTIFGNIIYDCMSNEDMNYKLDSFYMNMNEYIFKLRRGRIAPDNLRIDEYVLPDVFSFGEGEVFFHSLLRNSKVIKKEIRNNILISLIGTKTGIYEFRKNPI